MRLLGPGPDDGELAAQDVDHLRQLVEVRAPEDATEGRDAEVLRRGPVGRVLDGRTRAWCGTSGSRRSRRSVPCAAGGRTAARGSRSGHRRPRTGSTTASASSAAERQRRCRTGASRARTTRRAPRRCRTGARRARARRSAACRATARRTATACGCGRRASWSVAACMHDVVVGLRGAAQHHDRGAALLAPTSSSGRDGGDVDRRGFARGEPSDEERRPLRDVREVGLERARTRRSWRRRTPGRARRARASVSWLMAAHSTYQGTRTRTDAEHDEPRQQRVADEELAQRDRPQRPRRVASTAETSALRAVGRCSGRPNAYAARHSSPTNASDQAKRDDVDHDVLGRDRVGLAEPDHGRGSSESRGSGAPGGSR